MNRTISLKKQLCESVPRNGHHQSQCENGFAPNPESEFERKRVSAAPRALLHCMSDIQPTKLEWLWPGRIPLGKLTLLAGDPGLGKSFVTMDMAARVSRGEAWPDAPEVKQPAGSAIIFSAEDDLQDTIRPRLDRAGADVTRIHAVPGVQCQNPETLKDRVRGFNLETDLPLLEEALREVPGVRLITVDPISAYCGGTDSHKNAEVRAMLTPLAELASRYRVAVVAVTHLSKGGGSKAVYRAMGSLAFAAAARAVWAVTKDQSDPNRRLILPAKMNLSEDSTGLAYSITDGYVAWEAEPVRMTADEAFAAEMSDESGSECQEAAEWLRDVLSGGSLPAKEVMKLAARNGISDSTLRRAKSKLKVESQRCGFGKGSQVVWELPIVVQPGP